jgi:hypothetical protein
MDQFCSQSSEDQLKLGPNVAVEWLVPLLRIREILGSNLGPETGYPEGFRGFIQSLHVSTGIILSLATTVSFRAFCNSLFINHDMIGRCVVSDAGDVIK